MSERTNDRTWFRFTRTITHSVHIAVEAKTEEDARAWVEDAEHVEYNTPRAQVGQLHLASRHKPTDQERVDMMAVDHPLFQGKILKVPYDEDSSSEDTEDVGDVRK